MVKTCTYDPQTLKGNPIVFHCPECSDAITLGLPHYPEEIEKDKDTVIYIQKRRGLWYVWTGEKGDGGRGLMRDLRGYDTQKEAMKAARKKKLPAITLACVKKFVVAQQNLHNTSAEICGNCGYMAAKPVCTKCRTLYPQVKD